MIRTTLWYPANLMAGMVLMLAVVLASVGAAAVHTALLSSSPAPGDTVDGGAVKRLELHFSGPVDGASSEIALLNGLRERRILTLEDESDMRSIVARLDGLQAGGYRVEWRTIAADGHPVTGNYAFYVTASEGGDSIATAPLLPPPPPSAATVSENAAPAVSLLRAGAIGSLGALTGLLLFIGWIRPGAEGKLRSLASLLVWLAPALLIAHAVAWARYAGVAAGGPGVWALMQGSAAGRMELLRIALALLALWALVLARRPRIAAAFALGAVFASGYAGHSALFSPLLLVPGRAIHIAAFAAWAGSLIAILLFSQRGEAFLEVTRTLSSIALFAVLALLFTGVAHLLLYPTSVPLIAQSWYGVLIGVKIAGLGLLSAFGARNRLRLIPALPDPVAESRLRRAVRWELGIMAVLIVATGFLTYLPVPQAEVDDLTPQLTTLTE